MSGHQDTAAGTVQLLDFPVGMFTAFDEVTEGLLRDYLFAADAGDQPFSVTDVDHAREAKHWVAAALADRVDRGPTGQLRLLLTTEQVAGFATLQAVLEHANRLAHGGQLLALPVLPEVAEFRNWLCGQVATQAAGGPAEPWRPGRSVPEQPGVPPASWAGMAALPQQQAWIAGDDGNRIIGASAAAHQLLGWDNLVGERILAVIPPEYREAHVAAFTRATVSGDDHAFGRPLELAAWTRDGRRVPVWLTLSRREGDRGRTVFLARIEPR